MLTQTIMVNLTQSKLSAIIMRSEEKGRQIQFEVFNEAGEAVDLNDYAVKFIMLKPDENIVMTDAVNGVVTQTEQMTTAKGAGYYCIRLIDDDTVVYSGQGKVLIDDHVVDDETLQSISEVDGLIFPDDFLTTDTPVAMIDDTETSTDTTWSSSKISDEIEAHAGGDVSKTVSGNPVTFTDGAAAPLVKCVTEIQGYQEGSGTPSPDNVRPIVAYTEGKIEVRGKNLFDPINVETFDATGQGDIRYGHIYNSGNYTIVNNMSQMVLFIRQVKKDLSEYGSYSTINALNYAVANVDDEHLLYVYYQSLTEEQRKNICVNLGNDTTYEPYKGVTHTTTYPSAIYRGSEDVVNGEVTANRVKIVLDGSEGSTNWRKSNSKDGSFYYIGLTDRKVGSAFTCNMAPYADFDDYVYGTCSSQTNNVYVHFWLMEANKTLTDWMTWLSSNPIEIEYELATPTTSSITPTNLPIKSLSGYTHIESSTGDMEVEYITEHFQPLIDSIKQL